MPTTTTSASATTAKQRGVLGIVPPGTKVQGDLDLDVGTYAGGYRFDTFGENTIDVLFGAQLTNLDETLKVPVASVKLQNKDNLTDTVVMLRPSFQISARWRFNPTLAYGVSAAIPTKCPDADHDSVCDAVDQCPNTPAGARIGPGGCDCDYVLRTHFAFDSAELTAEDKAEIDRIIPVLLNPKVAFIAGRVTGYTDDVGDAKYNERLSLRRAQAVANYVKSKGVSLGDRFQVVGMGEANPIADNKTEAGRAQNRRVALRRTDCGPAPTP